MQVKDCLVRMENSPLHQQLADMRQSLLDEGIINEEFNQLVLIEDAGNANFVEELLSMFFEDSTRQFASVDNALIEEATDFKKMDKVLHELKGITSSLGVNKILEACIQLREDCNKGDVERCKATFEQMKKEFEIFKKRMEEYLQVAKQTGPSKTFINKN